MTRQSPPGMTTCAAIALMFGAEALAQQAGDSHQHDDHAQHLSSGSLPLTPIPPLTDADRAAAVPPEEGHPAHDNHIHGFLLLDQLEVFDDDDEPGQAWDIQGWLGTDINRLWLRSEGERANNRTHSAQLELFYGRSISAWWDVLAGVRHDARPKQARTFAAFGIQGTAPQWLELELTAYVGEGGRTALRLDADYELNFTSRLILQWQVQLDAHGKNDSSRGIGSGLSLASTGARLRYEFTRRFAPYLGVEYERAIGKTADLHRLAGEPAGDTRVVAGIRTWF